MDNYHQSKKRAISILLASNIIFFVGDNYAKTEPPTIHPATTVERVTASTKYKALTQQSQAIDAEAAAITQETQEALLALDKKDTKEATKHLQSVSSKLDTLLAKNPELDLVPAAIEADVDDFEGTNKQVAAAINTAENMLKHGKLQAARQILAEMASEIRITITSIPLGGYQAAIKQIIPLIDAGKIDQATVDLNAVLDTLVVTTTVTPLPVLRAEELLTVAAELEHRDDLAKEANRQEIQQFTDAAKDKLELAQLLGYGEKEDYKLLYKEIDAIHKTLFSEKSAAVWQKIKNDLSQFKNRLMGLKKATAKIDQPAK